MINTKAVNAASHTISPVSQQQKPLLGGAFAPSLATADFQCPQ